MKRAKLSPKIALSHLQELCARGEKSPFEIEKKLKQWGLEEHVVPFLDRLVKEDFINLKRFAHAFTKDKLSFNKWGKIKIRYYLHGHRIPDNIIGDALDSIQDDKYFEIIETELSRKMKTIKSTDPYQKKSKLYAFGSQRGYEADLMNRIIDKLED